MNETIEVVVVAAMEEEAAPFLEGLDAAAVTDLKAPFGQAWHLRHAERDVVVMRAGIGVVNGAAGATWAINTFNPKFLLSAGSAGGLATGLFVGDVVVGTSYLYMDADATNWGYELGQIPGMPPTFQADPGLVERALTTRHRGVKAQRILPGKILSGDRFVDERNVDRMRADFPGAIAVDMESTAIAHVAYLYSVPFVSVHGISDLCGQQADLDHTDSLTEVARRSAKVLSRVIDTLPHD